MANKNAYFYLFSFSDRTKHNFFHRKKANIIKQNDRQGILKSVSLKSTYLICPQSILTYHYFSTAFVVCKTKYILSQRLTE